MNFINEDNFNFAFDIVDDTEKDPDKLAMLHLSRRTQVTFERYEKSIPLRLRLF